VANSGTVTVELITGYTRTQEIVKTDDDSRANESG